MSVTGIGGLFFRCPDPADLRAWYGERLGLRFADGGGAWFAWRDPETGRPGRTVFGPFPETTEYFDPGTKPFMVNYRVEDLGGLLDRLRGEGETVIDGGYESRDGRFAWVIDPDGQKVEL
ncbi:MAG: VOC family protein, partial [Gemmatimonadota bacterium]|nr:VOC family protein [Gemmatimonadota bacterium]